MFYKSITPIMIPSITALKNRPIIKPTKNLMKKFVISSFTSSAKITLLCYCLFFTVVLFLIFLMFLTFKEKYDIFIL